VAQTWRVTPAKRFAFRLLDRVGAVAAPLIKTAWPPRPASGKPVQRILVIELWLLGDAVLMTPILRALRDRFPGAEITVLVKPHAEELLRESELADHVIKFDFPWTADADKYKPSRYDRRVMSDLIRQLREQHFDLAIDGRMDVRSSALAYATGAPTRIGYDFGGGGFLLTHALRASPNDHHRAHDWLKLLEPLDDGRWNNGAPALPSELGKRFAPRLKVSLTERADAERLLRSFGIQDGELIVGIHPGASRPRGRWPLEHFGWIADSLESRHGSRALIFVDPEGYGEQMPLRSRAHFIRAPLREMMALMTCCDIFICNDSGPMHIADALGVPVIGIFTTGNPVWHRPFGESQRFVGRGTGHDFVSYPTREEVLTAAEEQIADARSAAGKETAMGSADR
jgi:ADP-heptose:LPS heptosyltransferase